MNNKCYAKFMADMEPLIEALLKCEEDARAPHTPSGQPYHGGLRSKLYCKQCGSGLKGRWNKDLKRWTLVCPKCKKIRYKSTDVGVGGKESYVEVDLPWEDE